MNANTLVCCCCKNVIGYYTQDECNLVTLYCVKCYTTMNENSEKSWQSFSDSNPTNKWIPSPDVIKCFRNEVKNIDAFRYALLLNSLENCEREIDEIDVLRALKKGGYTKTFNYALASSTAYYQFRYTNYAK